VDVSRHGDAVRARYAVDGWGVGELVVRDSLLLEHAFPSRQRRLSLPGWAPLGGANTPEVTVAGHPSRECHAFVSSLCRRVRAHLSGEPTAYDDVAVDEDGLSAFQRELLGAARSIAWADVVTYGGLAGLAGRPRAARAAGTFCAESRLSLVVPCHRIVAAGRAEPFELGGYGSPGGSLKRRLLALEGTLL